MSNCCGVRTADYRALTFPSIDFVFDVIQAMKDWKKASCIENDRIMIRRKLHAKQSQRR